MNRTTRHIITCYLLDNKYYTINVNQVSYLLESTATNVPTNMHMGV